MFAQPLILLLKHKNLHKSKGNIKFVQHVTKQVKTTSNQTTKPQTLLYRNTRGGCSTHVLCSKLMIKTPMQEPDGRLFFFFTSTMLIFLLIWRKIQGTLLSVIFLNYESLCKITLLVNNRLRNYNFFFTFRKPLLLNN